MDFQGSFSNPQILNNTPVVTIPAGTQFQNLFSAANASGFYYDLTGDPFDSSPIGNDGIEVNLPTYDAGDAKPGTSLVLAAASTQYLQTALLTGALAKFGQEGYFTIGGFAKLASGGGLRRIISAGNSGAPASFEWALFYNNASRFAFSVGDGSAVTTVTDTQVNVSLNTWYFVVGQFNPALNVIRISVNRSPWVTTAFPGTPLSGANTVLIGNDPVGLTRLWDGKLDTVFGITGYVTDEMLDRIYNAGSGRLWGDL